MTDLIEITSGALIAAINPLGAELISLRDTKGRELMTNADPAFWTGHAPVLFPIVGRLNGDTLRIDGASYEMKQHGFARRKTFDVVEHSADAALFRLTANEETRREYPFDFVLEVRFTLNGATLSIDVRIANPGPAVLPTSLGFHPAFAWPLPYGADRADHRIEFAEQEASEIEQLANGLFAAKRPSPVDGRTLYLADDLFAQDALIWDPVRSQSVTYGPVAGPNLRVDFPDTPYLGIWTKPGASFVCIEPWHGHADLAGFAGDFRDKPGVFKITPGGDWRCSMAITLTG